MKLLGITGGVGMGKSTTAALLARRGIPVIDTDQIARQVVEPGQPALAEIVAAFGEGILSPGGALNRKELACRVFADADERARLEAILHPRIHDLWQAETVRWRAAGSRCGAVVIPLLYETKVESYFDAIICVACSRDSQFQRLRERGWSAAEIRQRLAAQWPVDEKINRVDFVIWTESSVEEHAAQLDKILAKTAE